MTETHKAPTREEINELIEFCRGELNDRSFSGYELDSALRALAIVERLPALLANPPPQDIGTPASLEIGMPKHPDEMTEEELLAGLEELCSPASEEIVVTREMMVEGRRAFNQTYTTVDSQIRETYRAMRAKEPKQ